MTTASSDALPPSAAPVSVPPAPTASAFAFTDPGCRTDIRLGALAMLAAVFLWLWFGPETSARIYLAGAPLLLWGVPWQAIQARSGRPGYPWKLGVALTAMGVFSWLDLRYREAPGADVQVQIIAPLLTLAGAWILAWWPIAVLNTRHHRAQQDCRPHASTLKDSHVA